MEEAKDVYGEDSLIPISFIKQIIFYTSHGCQPKFTCESEKEKGKIVCWFLKSETSYLNKKWTETKYEKQ